MAGYPATTEGMGLENDSEKYSRKNHVVREVIEIHWPMNIPENASFAVSSLLPLKISVPCSMEFHVNSPIHIRCDRKLKISPAGPATPGFARGWLKMPDELKLQIVRYNLTFSSPIWPSNVNIVTRRELLPYLKMTPDIAVVARTVFYQENRFIMQFSSSTPTRESVLARPPMEMRPQLRRITFLTRFTMLDWEILRAMAGVPRAGFTGLVYLEVRCLSWETAAGLNVFKSTEEEWDSPAFENDYIIRRGDPIHLPFDGVVTFDRSGFVTAGTQEEDDARWALSRRVEEYVTRDITFMKQ